MLYVAELSPGVADDDVLEQANTRNAVLVTADKDFGELVYRQRRVHAGVVLLRLTGLSNATKASLVAEICRDRGAELIGAFSVVEAGQNSHSPETSFAVTRSVELQRRVDPLRARPIAG